MKGFLCLRFRNQMQDEMMEERMLMTMKWTMMAHCKRIERPMSQQIQDDAGFGCFRVLEGEEEGFVMVMPSFLEEFFSESEGEDGEGSLPLAWTWTLRKESIEDCFSPGAE